MSRADRIAALGALEQARESNVIAYVTSTRENFESQMAIDAIAPIYRRLMEITKRKDYSGRIDLFIHSNGGDGIVPWRLVTLVREYCKHFALLVPNRAFSAATLTALGADEVIMHPMGMLGPTDPTVTNAFNPIDPTNPSQRLGISVEDVTSYIALVKDDLGVRHEDELIQAFNTLASQVHPLALGNVKRLTLQSRLLGEKLLRLRSPEPAMTDHAIEEIVRKLTSELYLHAHPINRAEARSDLGLDFVHDASASVEEAMWDLWSQYADDLLLEQPYLPAQEAIPLAGIPPAAFGGPPNQVIVNLAPQRSVMVESTEACEVHSQTLEAVVSRDSLGAYTFQLNVLAASWSRE